MTEVKEEARLGINILYIYYIVIILLYNNIYIIY